MSADKHRYHFFLMEDPTGETTYVLDTFKRLFLK